MIKRIYKKYNKALNLNTINISKAFACFALASTISLTPAYAQQIIIDGNTNTSLNINGSITDITTNTIKGNNAFNSFSKFNVNSGNIVNLQVPSSSSNLINLVHDEASQINGILNSIKDGHIGGNIFLVNPHGITVGSQGVINVGSLTALTPTTDFMNNFFTSPGNPSDSSITSLLNGTTPINPDAIINIEGKINAIENVKIDSGDVYTSGEIYSGAVFQENDITIGDVVNINTLESGSEIAVTNGEITIHAANNVIHTGIIVNDGGNNLNANNINITADNNITFNPDSLVSAKGKGLNSNAGEIYTFAQMDSFFKQGAILDTRGGNISGDAGFIELSANRNVEMSGTFKAYSYNGQTGNILVDPVYEDGVLFAAGDVYTVGANLTLTGDSSVVINGSVISTRQIIGTDHANGHSNGNSGSLTITAPDISLINNARIYTWADNGFEQGTITINPSDSLTLTESTLKTYDTLTLNGGDITDNGINFQPTSIEGTTLVSNFLTQNADFNITSNANVSLGNLDTIYIGGNPLNPTNVNINAGGNLILSGAFSTSGTFSATSTGGNIIRFGGDESYVAGNNITLSAASGYIGTGVTPFRTELSAGTLTVTADGNVNIIERSNGLNVNYILTDGDVTLNVPESILDQRAGENPNIRGNNINITSGLGTVGTALDDFDVDTKYSAGDGKLTITSYNGLVNVSEFSGNLELNTIISNENVTVSAPGNIIDGNPLIVAVEDANIRGRNIVLTSTSGTIGTSSEDLDVDTQYATADGTLTATAMNGLINISETAASLEVNSLISEEDVWILSPVSILDGSPDDLAPNIRGRDIIMTAQGGTLGTAIDEFDIDTKYADAEGILQITCYNGIVNVAEFSGDLDINTIISNNHITLTAPGSLLDGSAGEVNPNVRGRSLFLTSQGGTIGTALEDFNIDVNFDYGDGELTATAMNGLINLNEISDDLQVVSVTSNFDVSILSPQGILDANPSEVAPNVRGRNITLTAQNGTVGSIADEFDVDTKYAGADGVLTVTSYNGIVNIAELSGNLEVNNVISNHDVTLLSPGGILDGSANDAAPNVRGEDLYFTAQNGSVGTALNDFDVDTKFAGADGILTIVSYNGLVNVSEFSDNLEVNTIISNHDVTVSSPGSILDAAEDDTNPNIRGENITLTAQNGTVGATLRDFDVDTRYASADGVLTITSYNGLVNVAEFSDDLALNTVVSNENVNLVSPISLLDGSVDDAAPNVRGKSIVLSAQTGTIGTAGEDLDVDTKYASVDGSLTGVAFNGLINISEFSDNLDLNFLQSNHDVKLLVPGNILDARGTEDPNVYGNSIYLNSATGNIGSIDNNLDIYTNYNSAGGTLTAFAKHYINLNQYNGELPIQVVSNAGRNDIKITSKGNILDSSAGELPNIYANDIYLQSYSGSLGTANDNLDLYLNYNSTDGALTAFAKYYINLHQYNGALNIQTISNAGRDDTKITAQGNILDASTGELPNIYTNDLFLQSYSGSLGSANDNLDLYLNYNSTDGALTAFAKYYINLHQYNGALNIQTISNAGRDDTKITAQGNILDSSTGELPNIYTNDLFLQSYSGSLGSANDNLDLYLNYNSTDGTLTAFAKYYINLHQYNGALNIQTISNAGRDDTKITAQGNILDANTGELPNIYTNDLFLQSYSGSLGTTNDNLDLYLNYNSTDGALTAFAKYYINLHQYNGDLSLIDISNAGRDDTKITAKGNILDAKPGEYPNIYTNGLYLQSYSGSLGTINNNLDLNLNYNSTDGTLMAFAKYYINLHQYNGNLSLVDVSNAGRDDVKITAQGNILDAKSGEYPNIYANDIYLQSYSGSLGTSADDLDLNLNYNSTGGALTAFAKYYINLQQYNGDLSLIDVSNAGRDDVKITAQGNILDAKSGEYPNIYARGITLESTSGSIGSLTDNININLNHNTTGGLLTATANAGLINLSQYAGNLMLNTLTAGSNVTLTSAGAIYTYSAPRPIINITGTNINLTAATAIGTIAIPIEIDASGTVTATSPDTHIHEN